MAKTTQGIRAMADTIKNDLTPRQLGELFTMLQAEDWILERMAKFLDAQSAVEMEEPATDRVRARGAPQESSTKGRK